MAETPYLEANALLALQDGDEGEARRILDEMLPAEARRLRDAAWRLTELADVRQGGGRLGD